MPSPHRASAARRKPMPLPRPSSPGSSSQVDTPMDIEPGDACWNDRQVRPIHVEDGAVRAEALLDTAIELSFPASDPIAELQVSVALACFDAQEAKLDQAIEMTFPASDPLAVSSAFHRRP